MKKLFTLLVFLATIVSFAQAPQGFNYQATIRNATGQLVLNQNVNFRFSVRQGSSNASPIYVETHQVPTDSNSQVNLVIGQGSTTLGDFSLIDWSLASLFLGVELDTGNGFVTVASSDLISVPFALYANKAGSTLIPSLGDVLAKGNDANATKITNLGTPVDPKDAVNLDYLTTLKTKLDQQALSIKMASDTLIKRGLQEPSIEWEKELISPSVFNTRVDSKQTADGGFVVLSMGNDNNVNGGGNTIISRLDSLGNPIWQKVYDYGTLQSLPQRIIGTTDLGFILCGFGNIIKLNEAGDIQWQNPVFQNSNGVSDVFLTSNGIISSNGSNVAKIDNAGMLLWNTDFSNYPNLAINAIKPTADGGTIVVGRTYSNAEKDFDALLIKLDSNGTIQWSTNYGGKNSEDAQRVCQTKDGGYLFAGYTNSTELNPTGPASWIVKTNDLGVVLWQKYFENIDYGYNFIIKNIDETTDGSIICAINSATMGNLISKLDAKGNFQWDKALYKYKYSPNYLLNSYVTLTSDNGFFVTEITENEGLLNGGIQATAVKMRVIKLSYKQ